MIQNRINNVKKRLFYFIVIGLIFWNNQAGYAQTQANSVASSKYNVLFIGIDDMRPDVGAYGNSFIRTPNIDQLAQRGILFNRAYCQQAVCAPSRASLMTGLRPDQLEVWDLQTHFRKKHPDIVTLPQYFKKYGYHARSVGKIYHDPANAKDPQSWSAPSILHITQNGCGHKYALAENCVDNNKKAAASEMADVPDSAYIDGKVANAAIEILNEIRDSTFFLAVGFRRPHLPFSAPKRYWDLYEREKVPMPENSYSPENAPELALHNWVELRGYTDIPEVRYLDAAKIRELRHGYYAAISYVDAQIGKLIHELERLQLMEKTVIVLWSDHGFHLGEHGLWCKTTNFELDTRVPLIFCVPGQKTAGAKTDAIVEYVDIYPTLADVCGLPVPKEVAGKSLKPLITNPSMEWEGVALSQFPRPWFYKNQPEVMGYSIRTDRYRYTQWVDFSSGETVAKELYDHVNDPDENVNVAQSNQNITADLEEKLKISYQKMAWENQ